MTVNHVVERRHDERFRLDVDDHAAQRLRRRRDVVPRLVARHRVGDRHVPLARLGRSELTRADHRHVVVEGRHVADQNLGVGRPVLLLLGHARTGHGQLKRRDLGGNKVDFLVAADGRRLHPDLVRPGVADRRDFAPRLAVERIENRVDRTVELERNERLAAEGQGRPLDGHDLFDRADVDRAAVEAVAADRVKRRDVVRRAPGVHHLVVADRSIAVGGEQVAAVVHHEVRAERHRRKVDVAAGRRAGAQIENADLVFDFRIALVHQDAVIERESRPAFAADRAAEIPRNRHVHGGVHPAVRRGDPLVVPDDDDVGQIQLAAVIAQSAVRRDVVHEDRIGDVHDRFVPDVDRRAVRSGAVPVEIRTGNIGRRRLFDVEAAAVRLGVVVRKDAVDHRQVRAGADVNRAPRAAGVGVGHRHVVERQVAARSDRAPLAGVETARHFEVGERHRTGKDLEPAVFAPRVECDAVVAVDRKTVGRIDLERAARQRDLAAEPLREGDFGVRFERLGVGDRFADRGVVVGSVDDVFERRHDKTRVVGIVGGRPGRGGQKGAFFEVFELEMTVLQQIHFKSPIREAYGKLIKIFRFLSGSAAVRRFVERRDLRAGKWLLVPWDAGTQYPPGTLQSIIITDLPQMSTDLKAIETLDNVNKWLNYRTGHKTRSFVYLANNVICAL